MYRRIIRTSPFIEMSMLVATIPLSGVFSPSYAEDVAFNMTSELTWNDYKKVFRSYSLHVDSVPAFLSCDHGEETTSYTQKIPFMQDVKLFSSSNGDGNGCRIVKTFYRLPNGEPALFFHQGIVDGELKTISNSNAAEVKYEGDLELQLYAKTEKEEYFGATLLDPLDGCQTDCTVKTTAIFFDEVPTTKRQGTYGPYAESIPVIRQAQELERVPLPMTQFTPEFMRKEKAEREVFCSQFSLWDLLSHPECLEPVWEISDDDPYGEARDFLCKSTTDKPDELYVWCLRQENELVMNGYTIAAQDGPLAPFTYISLVKSSGKKDGIVKVVKWKDDEFQKGHDLIEFIGHAIDIDGEVVEYRWESNKDGVISNQSSFFYTDLSLGLHTISFRAKDNDGLWSEPVTRQVEVVKPRVAW